MDKRGKKNRAVKLSPVIIRDKNFVIQNDYRPSALRLSLRTLSMLIDKYMISSVLSSR